MIDNKNFEERFASFIKDYNNANAIEKIDVLIKFAISIIMALNDIGISIDIITEMMKELIKEKKKNKMEE